MPAFRTVADAIASQEPLPITVKNTFVNVDNRPPACPPRRTSSLPPCLRGDGLKKEVDRFISDASTEFSTEASEDDASSPMSGLRMLASGTYRAPAGWGPQSPDQSPTQAASRSPLSAKAKAWQPSVLKACQVDGALGWFHHEAAEAVAAVKTALETSGYWVGIEAIEHGQGWIIMAQVQPEDMHRAEYLLKLAKEALLGTTEQSSSVKVMGYRQAPFLPLPQGFTASLGAVQDASQACYDAYGKGFCRRGCACRWEHPSCVRSVKVVVLPHTESP
mmetsp:Transcript_20787/g.64950  ORF Transcript_20787/g.64950 Transcript_20787/m.64950 type:complete len:276 (-) Transcript_20787:60-887(-)